MSHTPQLHPLFDNIFRAHFPALAESAENLLNIPSIVVEPTTKTPESELNKCSNCGRELDEAGPYECLKGRCE